MAVAAAMGGVSPNFDGIYSEITRLSRKLSVPSPREFNDPGQTLKLVKKATGTEGPKEYETFIRAYTDKEKGTTRYKLYFKDELGQEQMLSDGNYINNALFGAVAPSQYTLNGQDILNLQTLKIDEFSGRIVWNGVTTDATTPGVEDPVDDNDFDAIRNSPNNVTLGVLKLDATNGLDVGLVNERISGVNLVIEALNKVLIVAGGNLEKAVDLRI
ncbi:MAG: hypothetical protein ACK4IX_08085 [Candidatus Sericytochromatia bacterium]